MSLKCPDVDTQPLTAKELFDACVAPSIEADFKAGKYDNKQISASAAQDRW